MILYFSVPSPNLRFAGQYYDGETGLHYNWHRYYDPTTGRYLTPDPIGFAGGDANLYAYVWNDPINWVDPSGEFAQIAFGFVGGFVTDVLWQVFIDGQDLSCISYKRAFIAGGAGAAGIGLLKVFSKARQLYKLSKATKDFKPPLKLGHHKSLRKWRNRWKRGNWNAKDIRNTYRYGKRYKADNLVNKGNTATRYHNVDLDKSIVVDDVTNEIIQLGRTGFRY
jgi:RHS repeat-associated protein